MPGAPEKSTRPTDLRQRAEEKVRKPVQPGTPKQGNDPERVPHELEVHQMELEMQNVELQKARDELELAVEKYTDLYDFAPVGYLTLDRDGNIIEANLTAATLLGIERSALLKRRFALLLSKACSRVVPQHLEEMYQKMETSLFEAELERDGRVPVWLRIQIAPAASGLECRAVLEDVTERKRAAEERLVLNKLESTGILAGGIAHDFNNLLTVMLLNLEQALSPDSSGEELTPRLVEARAAVFQAQELTAQLLTFARGGAPVRKPDDMVALIHESARLALSGSNVKGEFDLAPDLRLANADHGQMGQVVRNIILNSRESMPQGGSIRIGARNVTLTHHQVQTLPEGQYVCVSIADQGPGIAEDVLCRIFDPYFSTKQRGARRGMGLGLSICHSVVQKHDGAIVVESVVGQGTTFHVYIPAAARTSTPSGMAQTAAPVPEVCHGRILVMDDEESVRMIVELSLKQKGYEVVGVESGQEALQSYGDAMSSGHPFDAVLLDIVVPGGMGGVETMRALLKIDPAVKAIVMSGYANDPVMLEHVGHGFKGAMAKPFRLLELHQMVAGLSVEAKDV
ncbi:MAG TPA: ATP-binding protein [Roseimicrobium sp.]|nr:ATP-binding protein [Roseimicrobium sp.]